MTLCPSTSRSPRIAERGGSCLTRIWTRLYTRPRMGTDAIQPSRRLAVTRLTDYPTTRLPNRATASRSAPVLSAAVSIRVAHSRTFPRVRRSTSSPRGVDASQPLPRRIYRLYDRHHGVARVKGGTG